MIVAWVALGLVAAVVAWVAVWSRLVESFQSEVLGTIGAIQKRLGTVDEEYTPLDEEQKRELRIVWGAVSCGHCGFLHPGLCPRVREMRYLPNGNPERIIFWGDGEWAVPKGAHSYRDVFGTEVPQTEEAK